LAVLLVFGAVAGSHHTKQDADEDAAVNEEEWLRWKDDPGSMLALVGEKASERKLRLFACACCRRILHLLFDERGRKAVEVGELFSDGIAGEQELTAAWEAANTAYIETAVREINSAKTHRLASALYAVSTPAIHTFAAANRAASSCGLEKEVEQQEQAALFRDILGNPALSGRTFENVVMK
jgi:hypothetical protein